MRPYEISDSGPIFVDSDRTAFFDVDETLVRMEWDENDKIPRIEPIQEHIKLLKEFAARDFFIVVWSDGGANWAREVVEMYGLTNFVDLVISKPTWYVDDLEATQWAMRRVYKLPDPKFKETVEKIMEEHKELFEDLAKGPKCDDPACDDCKDRKD